MSFLFKNLVAVAGVVAIYSLSSKSISYVKDRNIEILNEVLEIYIGKIYKGKIDYDQLNAECYKINELENNRWQGLIENFSINIDEEEQCSHDIYCLLELETLLINHCRHVNIVNDVVENFEYIPPYLGLASYLIIEAL